MSLLLALLAQIGPFPGIGSSSASPLPREDQQHQEMERRKRAEEASSVPVAQPQPDTQAPDSDAAPASDTADAAATAASAPAPAAPPVTASPSEPFAGMNAASKSLSGAATTTAAAQARRAGSTDPNSKLGACLAMVGEDPGAAEEVAQDWLKQAKGVERAEAGRCVGAALAAQQDFAGALSAFIAARDVAAPTDHLGRARLGAMAGNAALAQSDGAGAMALLDIARTDAGAAKDMKLVSVIATDRARALVGLKREAEAATALADARSADPANPEAWLLSATLSRRMNKLADAQAQIEQAAKLLPIDPEIGLEAGVVAVLAGHDDAARKSWESVTKMAPRSDAAATARTYLAQLDPAKPVGTTPSEAGR